MAAKKRKASSRNPSTKKNDSTFQSKFNVNETFDDSNDEFIAGRDQILLEEGPDAKRRRKFEEEDALLDPSDEEVLGYDVDEDEEEEDDYSYSKSSKRRSGELDDNSERSANEEEDDVEGLEAWGSSRKDYYNADNIETEADALEEENEAKRLQQKHLKAMKEADFGFDELDWVESGQGADETKDNKDGVVTEVLPQLEITDDMSTEERLKVLKSRYPEFEPLANDFVELQPEYADVLAEAQKAEETMTDSEAAIPIPIIKFRALASYLGSISMYFALLTSTAEDNDEKAVALSPAELRDHPIMRSLIKCRKQWETVKDWSVPDLAASDVDAEEDSEVGSLEESEEPEIAVQREPTKEKKSAKLSRKEVKLSKSQKAAEIARAEAEARRAEKIKKAEANLADLADLVKTSSKKSKTLSRSQEDDDSDIGDEGALTAREAEEKAQKKRSLRFYTSQIAQKANKRSAAGRNAGGDEDLPYRERLKDRQARLNAEAERRGRAQANDAEQLGGDSDEEDHRLAREIRGDNAGTDDDEYYDMVTARNKQKKTDKKVRAELAEAAQKGGSFEEIEEIGPDGKRRITYQIEKNKGLMAKRNKDVRNPRVKKRKKFEQKKKKLGSIRQVYKGGEGREGYGGELTGIKKNLVKSVKLG